MVDKFSIICDWLTISIRNNWVISIISWSYYLSPVRIFIRFDEFFSKLEIKISERTVIYGSSVIVLLPRVHVCVLLHSILHRSVFTVRVAILVKDVQMHSLRCATRNYYDNELVLDPILLRHPRVVHI